MPGRRGDGGDRAAAPRRDPIATSRRSLGRFVDAAWAYRFGPPAQDAIVASLERAMERGGAELLSQAFHFPAGRPLAQETEPSGSGSRRRPRPRRTATVRLAVTSRRLAYGVRIHAPGFAPVATTPSRSSPAACGR